MTPQAIRALRFRGLHSRPEPFVIANAWDVGSARVVARMGFPALATTSAGFAFSQGCRDNTISRGRMLVHIAELASATDLPLSADLENGFGETPAEVARTFLLAARAGAVGGSIEDSSADPKQPLFEIERATERVAAAVEAVRQLPFPFTVTARAETFLVGDGDIDDVILRLQAYQKAGADVLFAPGVRTAEDIALLVTHLDRPINVLMGLQDATLTLQELAELGVRRVSLGSALFRAGIGAWTAAAGTILSEGRFAYGEHATSLAALTAMFND